jgi:hypothetical protein
VKFVGEMPVRPAAAPAGMVEAQERGFALADEAVLPDNGVDGGLHPAKDGIGIRIRRRFLLESSDHRGDIVPCGIAKLACDVGAVGVTRPRTLERLGTDIAQAVAKIGRHLVGTVDPDLPEHADDFDKQGVEMDAGQAARFEPRLELIDMAPPQRTDAFDWLVGFTEAGEELGQGGGIRHHGHAGAEWTPWCRKVTKRPRCGQGEAPRPQRGEVDKRLAAVLHGDRESQAGDGIGINRDRDAVVAAKGDPMPLAGTAVHDPDLGTSDSSSSTAASTVSARAAI